MLLLFGDLGKKIQGLTLSVSKEIMKKKEKGINRDCRYPLFSPGW
jgi:hypothetical protein